VARGMTIAPVLRTGISPENDENVPQSSSEHYNKELRHKTME
jgi:hypothetical protein